MPPRCRAEVSASDDKRNGVRIIVMTFPVSDIRREVMPLDRVYRKLRSTESPLDQEAPEVRLHMTGVSPQKPSRIRLGSSDLIRLAWGAPRGLSVLAWKPGTETLDTGKLEDFKGKLAQRNRSLTLLRGSPDFGLRT